MSIQDDDVPSRPLTGAEDRVAVYAAKGYGIEQIAARLNLSKSTVATHVYRIALKLTYDPDISPLTRVQLWAAHREWRKTLPVDSPEAA